MSKIVVFCVLVCSLSIGLVGCGKGSETQVMIDQKSAVDIQAERDAREKAANEQNAKEMEAAANS